MKQKKIPFSLFRGGSSKAVFFHKKDLPENIDDRDQLILSVMNGLGWNDHRQVDGLGGGDSLTSKVAIVSPSERDGVDLDYLFIQVVVGEARLSVAQNCGNILAAVLPFAIEEGLIKPKDSITTARVFMENSGSFCDVEINTPNGVLNYFGDTHISGVEGTAAPVICNYLSLAGSSCGALFPTGNKQDVSEGIPISCIDNGMPTILIDAASLGLNGDEAKKDLNENEALKALLERIRLDMGAKMGLGDVAKKTVPKMGIVSPAIAGGMLNTRMFIPHVCHASIGVLAAASVAVGCLIPGTTAFILAKENNGKEFTLEHPSGQITIVLNHSQETGEIIIHKTGIIRTARLICSGLVNVPIP